MSQRFTFNSFSHIIVNDHGDIFDINTSACNICCNQNIFTTRFESSKCILSLFLTFSTVQGTSIVLKKPNWKLKLPVGKINRLTCKPITTEKIYKLNYETNKKPKINAKTSDVVSTTMQTRLINRLSEFCTDLFLKHF